MTQLIRRHRGYLVFAMMTLAVAVGVNLVVFTIVNALWLRPLPFPDADRLVTITSPPFAQFNPQAPTFSAFEAAAGQVMTNDELSDLRPRIVFDRIGRELETLGITTEYFQLFGLAIRGRDFTTDDSRQGAEPVAIISDRLWSREFGRRPDAIGAVALAKPFPIRIVGVAPPDFEGARRGESVDVWIPTGLVPSVVAAAGGPRDATVLLMVHARLRPGQSAADAKRHLLATADERGRGFMELFSIVPLKDVFGTPESRTIVVSEGRALAVVAGLAMLVLAGGCATLMALVLVHYERRRHELTVRIALGASRRRLARDLSRELGMLAAGGSIGAVLVAVWGLRVIPALSLPGGVDLGRLDLSMDWRVLTAAVTTSALSIAAAALLPLTRFTRATMAGELLAGSAATTPASSQRVRQALLSVHVGATIVVLVAAGLFVRAVIHGFGRGPGFDVDRTAFATVRINVRPIPDSSSFDAWRQAVAERTAGVADAIRAVPGIEDVAEGMAPIGADQAASLLAPHVVETSGQRRELRVGTLHGTADLLHTLGIPILAGRGLFPSDASSNPTPAIVTASLARALWPDSDAVDQVVSLRGGRGAAKYHVVGIARDFMFGSFRRPAAGVVVTARRSGFGAELRFAIRAGDPRTIAESIRKAVQEVEPDATWINVATARDTVTRDLGPQRLGAWFFSGFGLTALILGVGGVFGLVAYLAESRRREFGVRLALGATPHDLIRHGLSAALVPVSLGVAAGLLGAALVARVFASMLAGLGALDPITYAAVAATMLMCAALAGLGAAWRLRSMAPIDALRNN